MTSIKPCPYCGGEAILSYEYQNAGYADDFEGFLVRCRDSKCRGHDMLKLYPFSYLAIEVWNNGVCLASQREDDAIGSFTLFSTK